MGRITYIDHEEVGGYRNREFLLVGVTPLLGEEGFHLDGVTPGTQGNIILEFRTTNKDEMFKILWWMVSLCETNFLKEGIVTDKSEPYGLLRIFEGKEYDRIETTDNKILLKKGEHPVLETKITRPCLLLYHTTKNHPDAIRALEDWIDTKKKLGEWKKEFM